jgi:hypothetical protein
MADKPSVTLEGTVDKVIPPLFPDEPEKVQISVETPEHLYREVRIENTLTDKSGEKVSLIVGSAVEITISAEDSSTTVEPSVPNSQESKRSGGK